MTVQHAQQAAVGAALSGQHGQVPGVGGVPAGTAGTQKGAGKRTAFKATSPVQSLLGAGVGVGAQSAMMGETQRLLTQRDGKMQRLAC
jgi:hypothetical protein